MNQGAKLAIYSAILIGINIVFANAAAKLADPLLVSMYSLIISAILLFAVMTIRKTGIGSISSLNTPDFWKITVSRNIVGSALFIYGMKLTTAINSLIIVRLEPVFVIILGYLLLKESIKVRELLYVAAMVAGAVLVSTGGSVRFEAAQIGDLLILLSLLFLGYSYIPSRRIMKKVDPITLTAFSSLAGGLFFLPILMATGTLTMPMNALLLVIASALTYGTVGLVLLYEALKKIRAWEVSALLSVGPIAGGALAFAWLGESLNTVQLIGAAIVLAASYKISIGRK